jgi:hypothetical protein
LTDALVSRREVLELVALTLGISAAAAIVGRLRREFRYPSSKTRTKNQ